MERLYAMAQTAIPIIHSDEWDRLRDVAFAWEPPNSHVMPVSNALSAVCGLLWAASYVLLTIRAFKDRSYGMPIFATCYNVTWETIYAFIYPPDPFNAVFFGLWSISDIFLFVATARYGKHEWAHSPLVAGNLPLIMVLGVISAAWMQLALASELIPVIGREIVFFSSWPLQIVLGAGSLMQILSRDSTRGHSIHIWWTRAVGTLAACFCFTYRAYYWPERFGYATRPVAVYIFVTSIFIDVVYYFAFVGTRRREQDAAKKNGRAHIKSN
ncbi:hypothetical protein HD806DRAFT_450492 [Xylariaceae sp. AK1471]|nr:hypothetical protein HD806DRAFT_450492 [Xylariaceae sp. AK1471]